jgi:membrane-associated phospholipid phosphatase
MWGYGEFAKDHKALRDASLMFQATLYSATVATILKYTVREPRPNNSERRNSFPSGHSTTIFAFASYIGCRHSLPWGLAAYTAAAFVGFSRMNDNAHYLHDVTAGAAIGSAYGLGVCMAEERRLDKEKPVETMGYVVPIVNGLAAGFTHTF